MGLVDKDIDVEKLLTMDALHINKRKTQLNTRDEYRSLELPLKF